jgi:hypothetical protein
MGSQSLELVLRSMHGAGADNGTKSEPVYDGDSAWEDTFSALAALESLNRFRVSAEGRRVGGRLLGD